MEIRKSTVVYRNTHVGGRNGFPCSRSAARHMRPAMRSHAAKTWTSNSKLSMKNHWVTFPQVLSLPTLPLDERAVQTKPLTSSANRRQGPRQTGGAFGLGSGRQSYLWLQLCKLLSPRMAPTPLPWKWGGPALGAPGEMPEGRGRQGHRAWTTCPMHGHQGGESDRARRQGHSGSPRGPTGRGPGQMSWLSQRKQKPGWPCRMCRSDRHTWGCGHQRAVPLPARAGGHHCGHVGRPSVRAEGGWRQRGHQQRTRRSRRLSHGVP